MNPIRSCSRYEYLDSDSGAAMPGEEEDSFIAPHSQSRAGSQPASPLRSDLKLSDPNAGVDIRKDRSPTMHLSNKTIAVIATIVAACIGIGIGVIIGWFSSQAQFPKAEPCETGWSDALKEEDKNVGKVLMNEMQASNMKEYLRKLTSTPHLAGTPADKINADYVKNEWISYGLEPVRQNAYNVLLCYPDKEKPNYVKILNSNNTEFFKSQSEEPPLDVGSISNDTVRPFNAYAANGTVEGDLVYVNYGRVEDFQYLERTLHMNVTGKIAIARYGKIFRGDKAKQAETFGAVGLILYSDPADFAVDGISSVYPDSWWLPGSGVQRGSLAVQQGLGGDPLTPGYPSLENAFREDESSASLPRIPVQPIGYDDAKTLLGELEGDEVPENWRGTLQGLTYRLGPTLKNNRKAKLEVYNQNERRTVYNVIGMLRGSIEPDRYVILGNHRDAWVFGAVDPSSGTAVMMEIARVMGKLYKEGRFQPRRSIVFCSWAAEEYSLIGSTEWVEEFSKILGGRAVAYLNVDISVQGNYTFRAKATPNLFNAIYEAAKQVPDAPHPGHLATVYDTWLNRRPWSDTNAVPYVLNIGSGSDYAAFMGVLGISSVDLRYDYDIGYGISSYPLYHSMYETFHLVSEIMDPNFQYHLATGRVWTELARSLADALILPLDCRTYVSHLNESISSLKKEYADKMSLQGITFDAIDAALAELSKTADWLHSYIGKMEMKDPFEVRKVNDQLMFMERAFIDPFGLPGRPLQRHIAFAPSSKDSYYGDAFPGIVDLMFDIDNAVDSAKQWDLVRQHMSVVAFTLQSVASTLTSVDVLGVQP
ncbi:N-acetylated-alpha-linked acidic dipeptidase 2-like [Acanthaster planci]|uniref:glutamate carboxypeptidase II n=1 Tax=Acanthaster planci TaxID=133434 RepID=A0A8B7YX98_ACAPL|nr:N-acetylated-alpha-linked acidic dipeptidase 2-like [Acanthaster planci]XP_022097952.1 N-acetylated-alpha-linked acidic dipeptidase 2-like [Acanthaster planci]XP_022097953.1 N-acetylated-alpha-linked acidic dipeptidase 2-like [Acanthaster planci]XP_022097954.1 N-acetylated-alpha-linked acidic dipeptidase 2-like [Acanthaster planci]